MSWASFHVLEVMSSAKYLQKRVGYLGAVQSFRPDTEVLMLATNLLKKVCQSVVSANSSLPHQINEESPGYCHLQYSQYVTSSDYFATYHHTFSRNVLAS